QSHFDPMRMARRAHRLGVAMHLNGRTADSLNALEGALAMHEKSFGPDHNETADLLSDLGKIYSANGDYKQAQVRFARALRIHRVRLGENALPVAEDLEHLGSTLAELGEFAAASDHLEQALLIRLREPAASNPLDIADQQFAIANLCL